MFLLIHSKIKSFCYIDYFTFHYVSINTIRRNDVNV